MTHRRVVSAFVSCNACVASDDALCVVNNTHFELAKKEFSIEIAVKLISFSLSLYLH